MIVKIDQNAARRGEAIAREIQTLIKCGADFVTVFDVVIRNGMTKYYTKDVERYFMEDSPHKNKRKEIDDYKIIGDLK